YIICPSVGFVSTACYPYLPGACIDGCLQIVCCVCPAAAVACTRFFYIYNGADFNSVFTFKRPQIYCTELYAGIARYINNRSIPLATPCIYGRASFLKPVISRNKRSFSRTRMADK